jgi:hypothetical protein
MASLSLNSLSKATLYKSRTNDHRRHNHINRPGNRTPGAKSKEQVKKLLEGIDTPVKRGKRNMSPEGRVRIAEGQRKRWAKRNS